MAIAFLGIPAGIFVFPILTQFLIARLGWQAAWIVLAAFAGPLLIFVGLFIMRRQPSDYGLLPDGDPPVANEEGPDDTRSSPPPAEYSWTRAQALRSPTFWRLALILGLLQFSTSSVGLFRIPHFVERGIDPALIGFAYQGEAIASVVAGLPVGFALDRFQARYLASATIIPRVLSVLATIYATTALDAAAATVLNGLAAASFVVVQNFIWPSYFGSRHIGAIPGRIAGGDAAFRGHRRSGCRHGPRRHRLLSAGMVGLDRAACRGIGPDAAYAQASASQPRARGFECVEQTATIRSVCHSGPAWTAQYHNVERVGYAVVVRQTVMHEPLFRRSDESPVSFDTRIRLWQSTVRNDFAEQSCSGDVLLSAVAGL